MLLTDIDRAGHSHRKHHPCRHLIDMDAHRKALGKAQPVSAGHYTLKGFAEPVERFTLEADWLAAGHRT